MMACGDEVGGGCRACGPGVVESCSGVTIARKEEVKGTMVDGGCGVTQGRVGVGGE